MVLVGGIAVLLLIAIAMVLVFAHVTRPERVTLGLQTKWGTLGLEVVRPAPEAQSPTTAKSMPSQPF